MFAPYTSPGTQGLTGKNACAQICLDTHKPICFDTAVYQVGGAMRNSGMGYRERGEKRQ